MGSINFTGLENTNKPEYLYKDIHLDLKPSDDTQSNNLFQSAQGTDLKSSTDEAAVHNSLKNIFNTTPGEKLLNPSFGLALKQYTFEPMSLDMAETIGEEITKGIDAYEPRVKMDSCDILANYDNNEYIITLTLTIPPLNISEKSYSGSLSQAGFSFL
jgi:phage baseplate assembly protein W